MITVAGHPTKCKYKMQEEVRHLRAELQALKDQLVARATSLTHSRGVQWVCFCRHSLSWLQLTAPVHCSHALGWSADVVMQHCRHQMPKSGCPAVAGKHTILGALWYAPGPGAQRLYNEPTHAQSRAAGAPFVRETFHQADT